MSIVYHIRQWQQENIIVDKLEKFNKNFQWFRDHYKDLHTKYKGEYVAINDCKVIDHDIDYGRLITKRLKQRFGDLSTFFIEKTYESE